MSERPLIAHWLKYHCGWWMPGWLWYWADRRMDRYYEERR